MKCEIGRYCRVLFGRGLKARREKSYKRRPVIAKLRMNEL